MTDFVVFAFVTIVTFVLLSTVVGILISIIFNPTGDRSTVIGILADITTSMISALVGFIAGKGTGHMEAQDYQRLKEEERKKQEEAKQP